MLGGIVQFQLLAVGHPGAESVCFGGSYGARTIIHFCYGSFLKNFWRPVPLPEIAPRLAVLALPALLVLLVRLALLAIALRPVLCGCLLHAQLPLRLVNPRRLLRFRHAAKGAVALLINQLR